jgi:hypothetical protein
MVEVRDWINHEGPTRCATFATGDNEPSFKSRDDRGRSWSEYVFSVEPLGGLMMGGRLAF